MFRSVKMNKLVILIIRFKEVRFLKELYAEPTSELREVRAADLLFHSH